MKSFYITLFIIAGFLSPGFLSKANAQVTKMVYLSGTDKDHTVKWDFFCTTSRNSGHWDKIQVPSELHGYNDSKCNMLFMVLAKSNADLDKSC